MTPPAAPTTWAGGAEPATAPSSRCRRLARPLEDNVFVDSGDSTFVATVADDAESTFALDVDTGSFTVGAPLLDQGTCRTRRRSGSRSGSTRSTTHRPRRRPTARSASPSRPPQRRTPATARQLVRIAVDAAPSPTTTPARQHHVRHRHVRLDGHPRPPRPRQSSLALLVQHLRDDDTIAIVTYGDDATPVLAPTKVADAERIIAAIDELGPGGSTNMEAGPAARLRAGPLAFDPAPSTSSCWPPTASPTSASPTHRAHRPDHAGRRGGHPPRHRRLRHGQLQRPPDGAARRPGRRLLQLRRHVRGGRAAVRRGPHADAQVVADDAKAQVRFDPATVRRYRLLGYENRALDDEQFHDDTVDAGELGAGHAVTALYEVRPTGAAAAAARPRRTGPRSARSPCAGFDRQRRGRGVDRRHPARCRRTERHVPAGGARRRPRRDVEGNAASPSDRTSPSTRRPPTPRRWRPRARRARTSWPR